MTILVVYKAENSWLQDILSTKILSQTIRFIIKDKNLNFNYKKNPLF